MPKIPTLKGSKFILREFDLEKDKESIIKNINSPDILNKLTLEYPYDEEDWKKFEEKIGKIQADEERSYVFAIDINGEVFGSIGLFTESKECFKHKGGFGYWLAKKHWGQGIMTEALKLVSDFAFNEVGLLKLQVNFLEDNIGSKRVTEKAGFKFEYKEIKGAFKEGNYKNIVYTSKFKEGFDE